VTSTRRAAIVLTVPAIFALGACAGPDPAQPTTIATWSEPAGIAPELVYVTGIEGFELATQSVGVMGDDGMSAIYFRSGGGAAVGTVTLTTSRGRAADIVSCATLPDSPEPEPTLRCAVERGDAHVALEGVDVEAATLRAAAEGVRVPGEDELRHLFADIPMAQSPVERGDLPPNGDGAPLDPPGVGG
jgi:catechol 2,3-dioxygenase-like lactoylglutathione lyase family enzyme